MSFEVVRYQEKEHYKLWNKFVANENEACFLFHRDYLAYHHERYKDHSLMVFDKKRKLLMIMPACEQAATLSSHTGITYAGLIIKEGISFLKFEAMWLQIKSYLLKNKFESLVIKTIPNFYNPYQFEHTDILMFQLQAQLIDRKTSFVIDRSMKVPFDGNVIRAAKSVVKKGYAHANSGEWEIFWNKVLIPMMQSQFGKEPLHSLDEIQYLRQKFPAQIKLAVVYDKAGEIQAGTVLFIHKYCIHTQYIAATPKAKQDSVLHYLFYKLINTYRVDIRFFDLGTANTEIAGHLDEGLAFWKERLGALPKAQNSYQLNLK